MENIAAAELINTILPRLFLKRGRAAFAHKRAPKKLTSNCAFAEESLVYSAAPEIPKPALFIKISAPPAFSICKNA